MNRFEVIKKNSNKTRMIKKIDTIIRLVVLSATSEALTPNEGIVSTPIIDFNNIFFSIAVDIN